MTAGPSGLYTTGDDDYKNNHPQPRATADDLPAAQSSGRRQAIFEQTGQHPRLFWPAFGQISPASLWAAYQLNLQVMRWSCGAGEYNTHHGASAQVIADARLQLVLRGPPAGGAVPADL